MYILELLEGVYRSPSPTFTVLFQTLCIGLVCTTILRLTFRQSSGFDCSGPEELPVSATSAMWTRLATYVSLNQVSRTFVSFLN